MKKLISFIILITFSCLLIWFKFIKEKLPKIIPFNMNFFSLCLLCILILILLKTIFNYFLKKPKENYILESVNKIILAEKSFIEKYKLTTLLDTIIVSLIKHINKIILLEIFFRLFICFIFFIDVLFFQEIRYTYTFVYLYIYLYSLKLLLFYSSFSILIKEEIIETQTQIEYNGFIIPLQTLINKQINNLESKEDLIDYTPFLKLDYLQKRRLELNLKPKEKLNAKFLLQKVKKMISITIRYKYFVYIHHSLNTHNRIKLLRLSITIIYLCLWIFILLQNIVYLQNNIFDLVDVSVICNDEPFSCTKIK